MSNRDMHKEWQEYAMQKEKESNLVLVTDCWSSDHKHVKTLMLAHALLKNCEIRKTDTEDTANAMELIKQILDDCGAKV